MIRFSWLQARMQAAVTAAALAVVVIAAAFTGPHLAHLYRTTVANCGGGDTCSAALDAFLNKDSRLADLFSVLVLVVPALIGMFLGAPLIARELETGTHRLVWTQSVTRTRWLVVKLVVVGLIVVAAAGLLSLVVTWWSRAPDLGHANQFRYFDERDLTPVGYAAFAFCVGAATGLLIRRVLPAIAATLAAFVAVRFVVSEWVRPHLFPALHATLPLTRSTRMGFTKVGGPQGPTLKFETGAPHIQNALVLSGHVVDKAGHAPTAAAVNRFLTANCPAIVNPAPPPLGVSKAPADPGVFQACIDRLSANFREAVTYQPPHRYWPLQWSETVIFVGAALAVAGFCVWWIRRRRV